ncbi:MAG: hypothetical protein Q9162_004044 [Coniocarpon cinnabarinum]
MAANRNAVNLAPFFVRTALRSSLRSTTRRPFPLGIPAASIRTFRSRLYSTETSQSHGGANGFPPPGFNAEEAKKPLKQTQSAPDGRSQNAAEEAEQTRDAFHPPKDSPLAASRDEPTAHAKTAAEEAHSVSQLETTTATAEKKDVKSAEKKKEEEKKLTIWQKVKHEAAHYWDGTKLLAAETRISFRLAMKMAAGYELTRREHRQFHRTVQDLGRLLPFSVFVIVPFAELLLPVALRLFPNLLPSTYEGQKAKDAKAKQLRSTRKEVSSFLRQTLKETGLPVTAANARREEFIDFFKKVRTTGESPSAQDVIKVCKIFKDDLTLDNLSRPQLVGISRYMNMGTFGTDALLRYQIRHRMRQIKRDDRAISYEGVDSLSVPELQTACAARGLMTHTLSPGRLRDDLHTWLDLRLKYGVPSTLLVLANAFVYAQGKETEISSQIDALQAVLASVPEELFHEIELEVHTAEGAATNKQRLEVLREQQELIDEENQESADQPSPNDIENIDESGDAEQREAQAEMQAQAHQGQIEEQQQEVGKAASESAETPDDSESRKERDETKSAENQRT